jgi:BirA family biotin operon repressor/biotin-[acetyl-CoA-carboxylase] ligase
MQPLSLSQIEAALADLRAGPFGVMVHYYPQVGSTNDVARELAADGAPEGTVVIADEQTRGRGRLARHWVAPPNTSLLMSVIFRPALPPDQAHRLLIACGLALAEACEAVAGVRVDVKWPNDLLIDGKKVAGILAESAVEGERLDWLVVGAGLNVHQVFTPTDPLSGRATSLHMETGKEHDRAMLLAQILVRLNDWHTRVDQNVLLAAWRARCPMLGQPIQVETPDGILDGLAEDIDTTGALWLRDAEGQRHCLTVGEATIIPKG